jgi:integrase
MTVEMIWDAYRQDRDGRPIATTMGFERKAVLAHFGDMTPDDITDETCRAYARHRRSVGRKDGTVWTELGHLRTALKWAERTKRIAQASHIERPQKPPAKDRYLTREEAEVLLDATLMPHIRLFVILAITTAARASALLDLTWDRCDMERRLIHLGNPDAKGRRKGRATVPMNDTARAALAEAKMGARSPFVIEWAGAKVGKVRKGIESATRRAGLENVSPHVLRHTAAVWMAESGTPMSEIAQYLGHTSTAVTERVYARFAGLSARRRELTGVWEYAECSQVQRNPRPGRECAQGILRPCTRREQAWTKRVANQGHFVHTGGVTGSIPVAPTI